MTRTRCAAAVGKMNPKELGHEVLADVGQVLADVLHPHQKARHRRVAATHVTGSVAVFDRVLVVRQCVPLQLSAAARTA